MRGVNNPEYETCQRSSRAIFFNTGGPSNLFSFLNSNINLNEFEFICLAETWLESEPNLNQNLMNKFNVIFSKAVRNNSRGRASGGILFLCSKRYKSVVLDISRYWIIIKVTATNSFSFIVGGLYFPPGGEHRHCFDELGRLMDQKLRDGTYNIILLMDANARIGTLNQIIPESFFGRRISATRDSYDNCINNRGGICLNFMEEYGFLALNGRTPGDTPANFTFISRIGKSVIDLAIVSFDFVDYIVDSGILDLGELSEHFPYYVDMELDNCLIVRSRHRDKTTKLIWQPALLAFYNRGLRAQFEGISLTESSINELQAQITNSIMTTAVGLGLVRTFDNGQKYRNNKPWFDTRCISLKREMRSSLKICRRNGFNGEETERYLNAKKEYKSYIVTAKERHWRGIQDVILKCDSPNDFWKEIRQLTNGDFNPIYPNLELVKEHFTKIYNCFSPDTLESNVEITGSHDQEMDSNISLEELDLALFRLGRKKASGWDSIPGEFYKYLDSGNRQYLLSFFNMIFESGRFPNGWNRSKMFLIHKKGDVSLPANYRSIAILSTIVKIFTSILRNRLSSWAEERRLLGEGQNGFRHGRSCTDSLFILSSLINNQVSKRGGKLFAFFVDFRQAFDRINHVLLWRKLSSMDISSKVLKLLIEFYTGATVRIVLGENNTDEIPLKNGVLQGDSLSPLLFALFLSDFEEYFKNNNSLGIDLCDDQSVNAIFFADDLVLLASSRARLRKQIRTLEKYCRENQLTVNQDKSKIMVFRRGGRLSGNCLFYFEETPIEVVSEFTYLGVTFTTSGCFGKAARDANIKASFASYKIRSILQKTGIDSDKARITLFKSFLSSTLLYGAEVWGLQQGEEIENSQCKFIKALYFLPRSTPNYVIRKEFGTTNLLSNILRRAVNWFLKVREMDNYRLPRICLEKQLRSLSLDSKFNWLAQLRDLFALSNRLDLWTELLNGNFDARSLDDLETSLNSVLIEKDLEKIVNSNYCPLYGHILTRNRDYFRQCHLPLSRARVFYQLITSNTGYQSLFWGGVSHRFMLENRCPLCDLEQDSLEHFLVGCIRLTRCRALAGIDTSPLTTTATERMAKILTVQDEAEMTSVWNFLVDGLEMRRFMVAMLE